MTVDADDGEAVLDWTPPAVLVVSYHQAQCGRCGWLGPMRDDMDEACQDAEEHEPLFTAERDA